MALEHAKAAFTMIHDLGYSNVATPMFENDRRRVKEDEVTIVNGLIGAYPNAFFDVTREELDNFIDAMLKVITEDDYVKLVDLYWVRRTNEKFWKLSDRPHNELNKGISAHSGILDYYRLENR